jgi:nucleotide-binding universal stress UspA family protein
MAIKDILVHFEARPQTAMQLVLAATLARSQGARMVGLYVSAHGDHTPAAARKADAAAAALFAAQTAGAGVPTVWRCLPTGGTGSEGVARVLIRQVHGCDLLVLGQAEAGSHGAGLPERLILAAGRPVLVIPHTGSFATVGTRVLVAWSAGRAACRALHDALPILRRAEKVTLLKITGSRAEEPDEADICEHLAQHGIAAGLERQPILNGAIADQLLNRVCDEGFDLLVMGVGSATAAGMPGLGAVAGQILRQMTVPVLLAY